jgi:ariadne-1
MVCAAPWKTCSCPWFNYQHIDDEDRLNDMRIPYTTRQQDDVVEVIELPDEPSPPLPRRSSTRNRNRSGRDRDLEHTDRTLAARLQAQLDLEPPRTVSETRRADPVAQVYGIGNAMGHHMNDSYTIRPVANTSVRTTPRTSAPRGSFFSRRVTREAPAPAPVPAAAASAMAGLSKDGRKVGANRVGTWLSHIQVDPEAIDTAPRNVEVDEWRCDGTMIGID